MPAPGRESCREGGNMLQYGRRKGVPHHVTGESQGHPGRRVPGAAAQRAGDGAAAAAPVPGGGLSRFLRLHPAEGAAAPQRERGDRHRGGGPGALRLAAAPAASAPPLCHRAEGGEPGGGQLLPGLLPFSGRRSQACRAERARAVLCAE